MEQLTPEEPPERKDDEPGETEAPRVPAWHEAYRKVHPAALAALALGLVIAVFAGFWIGTHREGSIDASAPPSRIDTAEQELRSGQPSLALHDAFFALGDDPSDASTANRVAVVAHAAHDNTLYVRALFQSEVDAPGDWRTYDRISDYFVRAHNFGAARMQLHAGIAAVPNAPHLHYKLGQLERGEHRYRQAVAAFSGEPRTSPDARAADVALRSSQAMLAIHRHPHRARRVAYHVRPPSRHSRRHPRSPAGPARLVVRKPHAILPAGLSNEARAYLTGESDDFAFTHALPPADAYHALSPVTFERQLGEQLRARRPNIDVLVRMGTAALENGDLPAAADAFTKMSSAAPRDWRGPYLAGVAEEANNHLDRARDLFIGSEARARRPEPWTSLALLELRERNLFAAERAVRQAIRIDPRFSPARFTEGTIALIRNDPLHAQEELSATLLLPSPPTRAPYFLNRLNGGRAVVVFSK